MEQRPGSYCDTDTAGGAMTKEGTEVYTTKLMKTYNDM